MIIERVSNKDRTLVVSVGTKAIYVEVCGKAIRLTVAQADIVAEALYTAAAHLEAACD